MYDEIWLLLKFSDVNFQYRENSASMPLFFLFWFDVNVPMKTNKNWNWEAIVLVCPLCFTCQGYDFICITMINKRTEWTQCYVCMCICVTLWHHANQEYEENRFDEKKWWKKGTRNRKHVKNIWIRMRFESLYATHGDFVYIFIFLTILLILRILYGSKTASMKPK